MRRPLIARPATLCAQQGVAIVTALLLTTLAVTIVASLFWQQQVQVRSIENQRLQLQRDWIMRGALDWAKLILRAGGRQSTIDYLGQPWATPLADTRLDQYLEDGRSDGDAGDAILSGNIMDGQSRYNLSNLSANGANGVSIINPDELVVFKRLLVNVGVPVSLAVVVAQAIVAGQPPPVTLPLQPSLPGSTVVAGSATHSDNATLPIMQADDLLSLPGFTADMVGQLKDFIIVLPLTTPVNANTAPAEVLAACFATLTLTEANVLIASRRAAPFVDMQHLSAQMAQLFGKPFSSIANVGFSSVFFLVNGRLRMGRAALKTVSLIQRINNRNDSTIVWIREQ
ncbi:type II secretion system minor pseudopilin GspK [Glaciimonas sp. PAMC28666]|uniref:type II secretion system minor pseudopilin GspK n=1 Tax=Glaciimonas sp. PAMC28666 TaxID=2807626 RepID=UPI0019641D3E|nr:type II secretion system minor pseudopilin GspK [Glaciimonas sp. PAMC28666]QRX81645.1 type II secretion system minor pseudopilin GspK [Glaciimonas sp. PAMC28666]